MRPEIDSSVDKLVLSISKDLIDDFPASDPRWMESLPASEATLGQGTMGATMSLLILHQLEDKQTALEFFVGFLKEVGVWNKVSAFNEGFNLWKVTSFGIVFFVVVRCDHPRNANSNIFSALRAGRKNGGCHRPSDNSLRVSSKLKNDCGHIFIEYFDVTDINRWWTRPLSE